MTHMDNILVLKDMIFDFKRYEYLTMSGSLTYKFEL